MSFCDYWPIETDRKQAVQEQLDKEKILHEEDPFHWSEEVWLVKFNIWSQNNLFLFSYLTQFNNAEHFILR
jgi:hypothetical protein